MRAALVGLGMVSRTHVRAICASSAVELAGLCARDAAKARGYAESVAEETCGPARVYDHVDALAADPDVDFAILCTPPNARREIVERLIAAGKPILMEKPIERTLEAAEAIVGRCEDARVPLGVVFQHRMRPVAADLRRVLGEGALGELAAVEIAVPWWRPQSYYDEPGRGSYARDGGGVLISQAIHAIDLALSLAGPVSRVQAMARTSRLHDMESEDFVAAGLDFASGATGSLLASTASFPGGPESIALHGAEGSAMMRSGRLEIAWRDGRTESMGEESGTGGGADPMAFTHEWHQAVIEDFAAALRDGRSPVVTGRDALAAHRLIDAVVRSSKRGAAVEVGSDRT